MDHTLPNPARHVRAFAALLLLVTLLGCKAAPPSARSDVPSETPTASEPQLPSTAPTTVSTWDGAVLHTPHLDIPIRARHLSFSFYDGTTLYVDPRDQSRHVVHGDHNDTIPSDNVTLSSNGRWLVAYETPTVRVIDDCTRIAVQRYVRRNVRTGAEQVLTLPPATLKCLANADATWVNAVTDKGLVVLFHDTGNLARSADIAVTVWDGVRRVAQQGRYAGVWPRGIAVDTSVPHSKEHQYTLLALDRHLRPHRVARVSKLSSVWSSDARTYLLLAAPMKGPFRVGRPHSGTPPASLGLSIGNWEFVAWETPTSVILVNRPLVDQPARAIVRCDVDTLLCSYTTDAPGKLWLPG